MNVRRQAREIALQVLFQREFSKQLSLGESLYLFRQSFDAEDEVWNYARVLLEGLDDKAAEIDRRLSAGSQRWSLERMALVDLLILRIAAYELLFSGGSVPPKVAINEALEICKKYSSAESVAFVNGVLDQVAKHP